MGVTINDGEERNVGGSFLRTGATLAKVLVVGPTVEQMKTLLGFENARESSPAVDTNDTGSPRVRIDVWFARPEDNWKTKGAFFLVNTPNISSAGNSEWTNDKAQFSYGEGENPPAYDWWNTEGQRPAYEGEHQFINFIRALINHKGGKKAQNLTLSWTEIFQGNFHEIQDIINGSNERENRVGILTGVRTTTDGKEYQGIYMKAFARQYEDLFKRFQTELNKEYGGFKNHKYQNSLVWQQFSASPEVGAPEGSAEAGTTANTPWK